MTVRKEEIEAIQRTIDIIVAVLLFQGQLHATGVQIDRTGLQLDVTGPLLQLPEDGGWPRGKGRKAGAFGRPGGAPWLFSPDSPGG